MNNPTMSTTRVGGVPAGATVPCRSEVAEYPATTWWCLDQGISLSIPVAVVGGAFALLVVSQTAAGVIALGHPIR